MPVKSLVDLASAACIKNIRQLDSVGDFLPYENVRHILSRVENAHQLRRIELNSPQVEGRTGEVWLKLIERDFPLEYRARAYKPQNPAKWYRVWERYKKDHDASVEESVNKFKSVYAGLQQDKVKNTSKIVEGKLLPTHGRVKKSRRGGSHAADRSMLAFAGGSKTKMLHGADVMRRVRREVKEIKSIHGSLSKPVEAVNRVRGLAQVQYAPKGLANEQRMAAQNANVSLMKSSAPPAKKSSVVKEFEARATFISDSEDDSDDDHDNDNDDEGGSEELFDEPRRAPAPRPIVKARPVPEPRSRTTAPIAGSSRAPGKTEPSTARPSTTERPAAASLPKSGLAGRMAQKFGNPHITKKINPATGVSKSATTATMSASPVKRAPMSPSPPPEPSSPQASESKPALAPPRKRKAVGIFMRPKKRLP